MKSNKVPEVMSLESGSVGAEGRKFENEQKFGDVELQSRELIRLLFVCLRISNQTVSESS